MKRTIPNFLLVFLTLFSSLEISAQMIDSSGLQFMNYNNLVSFRAGLSNEYFDNSDTSKKVYLYAEVKSFTYTAPVNVKRSPLNLSVVIDKSGSMSGIKLQYVKLAACFLVDQMNADDFISIVEYSDTAGVLYKSAPVSNKEEIKKIINGIRDAGSTNIGDGLMKGYAEVKRTYKDGYINRVLLLSDGQANRGVSKQEDLEKIVRGNNDAEKITLSSFGVGLDYNENMMTALSEQGSGNYYFISEPETISDIFKKELSGLVNVVAQNAVLKIKIPKGLFVEKVYGYPYKLENDVLSVNYRTLSQDETKAILVRVRVEQPAKMQYDFSSTLSFFDVTLKDPTPQNLTINQTLMSIYNQEMINNTVNHKVMEQGVLYESIDMLDLATREVDKRNFNGARRLLDYNSEFLKKNAFYVERSVELKKQEELNKKYREKLTRAETMSTEDMKMMQKSNKEYNYQMKTKKMK